MRQHSLYLRVGIGVLCLMAALVPAITMAATPAGTQITATGTAQYYTTSGTLMPTVTSNTVTTTVGPAPAAGTYIGSWIINGYHPNTNTATRLSQDYIGGETTVTPSVGSTSSGKTWTQVATTDNRYIDLAKAYGTPTYCAAYAHVYVYTASAKSAQLWTGSDNGMKIWLNGAMIKTVDSGRGYVPDQDKTAISLKAGWNKLLIKVSQYGGNWGFSAKICDSSGNAVSGLSYSLNSPSGSADTTAPSISNLKATPGSTTATITWTTNEAADSQVSYGTSSLDKEEVDDAMVTNHSVTLTGLSSNTTYSYKSGSSDSSGNTSTMGTYTFKTTTTSTIPPPSPVAHITSWLVNGYYSNTNTATRLSQDYLGGEVGISPVVGSVSGGKTWFRVDSSQKYIDLAKTFNNPTYCVAYAHAYVYTPYARTVWLLTGSDNGIKIWLNDSLIHTVDSGRGYIGDQDKFTVSLKSGWNKVLVKISQYGGSWGFGLKFGDSSGTRVPDLSYTVQP